MYVKSFFYILTALSIFAFSGCGSKGPKSYECSGTVTLDGQPVEGASIAFLNPKSTSSGSAMTDASGKFVFESEAGDYGVTIVKLKPKAATDDIYAESENLLPKKYAGTTDSGLTASVTKDKTKNVFSFDLKKD